MEHDSDMNLTLVPKSSFQAAELCFEADADKINLDPSDDVSERKQCHFDLHLCKDFDFKSLTSTIKGPRTCKKGP